MEWSYKDLCDEYGDFFGNSCFDDDWKRNHKNEMVAIAIFVDSVASGHTAKQFKARLDEEFSVVSNPMHDEPKSDPCEDEGETPLEETTGVGIDHDYLKRKVDEAKDFLDFTVNGAKPNAIRYASAGILAFADMLQSDLDRNDFAVLLTTNCIAVEIERGRADD